MKQLGMRRLRIAKGLTQQQVGEAVGVSKVAIHDLETGKQKPSYDVLVKLENLFHKSHRYLFAQVDET